MRRTAICILALVLMISLSGLAKVRINPGTYVSGPEGEFGVKFWKEMFKGGGPGQAGNTLMALGYGFIFNKAVLQSVTVSPETGPAGETIYITTYTGGELTLNSKGPWLDSGILKAKQITATNESYVTAAGELVFEITFSGSFSKAPGASGTVTFEVVAMYQGTPEVKYENGVPVFQRGTDFDVTITIGVI